MCLVKVREEEDYVVPYRVHHRRRSPSPVRRRVSRTVVRERISDSQSHHTIPPPERLSLPPPQPRPQFHPQPPPPPPSAPAPEPRAHYVTVSPATSVTSHSPSRVSRSPSRFSDHRRSDYVVHERVERRHREYSPARSSHSPRFETYRYVDPPSPRRRSPSRDRSRYEDDDYGRHTRERIVISERDRTGRRGEYRR